MKHFATFSLAVALVVTLVLSAFAVSAATVENATIDFDKTGSITLHKIDITSAVEDGAWHTDSYYATGEQDTDAEDLYEYAIDGVVFTYLKVGEITTVKSGDTVEAMYTISDVALLDIISPEAADGIHYRPEALSTALKEAYDANPTQFKNEMEAYIAKGTEMPETNEFGESEVDNLELGLYLLVETKVPENVVTTTAPFFVSVPMTTVDGTEWNYDVVIYPKNQTGDPTLEKTVRESLDSTGKTEDYAHIATASGGDILDYKIVSTLPIITSNATYLTQYTFTDIQSSGYLRVDNKSVVIEVYEDAACTSLATTFANDTDYTFTATGNEFVIAFTEAGLAEINASYSEHTLVIKYSATLDVSSMILGDIGNENAVELEWKRTNIDHSDKLKDCCHVFSYGLDLTKQFAGDGGVYTDVSFVLYNKTDDYYVVAYEDGEGYADVSINTEDLAQNTEAPFFIHENGSIIVYGLEDDEYVLTEVTTSEGFRLLKEPVTIIITAAAEEDAEQCEVCTALLPSATATINGESTNMSVEENRSSGSDNAVVSLTVINNKDVDLPTTGESGMWILFIFGAVGAAIGAIAIYTAVSKKKQVEE